jgi:hypothetical protein
MDQADMHLLLIHACSLQLADTVVTPVFTCTLQRSSCPADLTLAARFGRSVSKSAAAAGAPATSIYPTTTHQQQQPGFFVLLHTAVPFFACSTQQGVATPTEANERLHTAHLYSVTQLSPCYLALQRQRLKVSSSRRTSSSQLLGGGQHWPYGSMGADEGTGVALAAL